MSYGTNSPQGLQPYCYLNGSLWTGQANQYQIASGYNPGGGLTGIFTGDPVTLLADGTIGIGIAGSAICGVFNGCIYTTTTGLVQYSPFWPASTVILANTQVNAQVIDDPNVLFNMQVQGTAAITTSVNTINLVDQNYNYNFVAHPGNTISGQSGFAADLTTQATTPTLNLKLLRLTPAVNNRYGSIPADVPNYFPFNNGLFLINNHIYKGGTGTAGI